MAYAIDLDDDMAESDIPTTVIRSKADLQGIEVGTIFFIGVHPFRPLFQG